PLIEATIDRDNAREWYSALMDYGSMLGVTEENANKRSAHYVRQSKFEGSLRQVRGAVLKLLVQHKRMTRVALREMTGESDERIALAVAGLQKDGLVSERGAYVSIMS
ncbi:TPA: endonuclease III, partial [Candidatus Wolfebacteria bacterium]|nr:endonuclease III [Candidatus Wolfebacteria bacterium]